MMKTTMCATLALLCLTASPAYALDYSLSYMTSWSGCDAKCNGQNPLSYTDDQINYLDSRLTSLGHSKNRKYSNIYVWASDLVEDKDFNGKDHLYSDDSDLYAFSGHGDAPLNTWGQTASWPLCKKGTNDSCGLDIERARLGERDPAVSYSSPNQGDLRYMIFFTCFSVHTKPNEQWGQTFWYGLDYVMGYRGLSADSSYTDEVGGDWADEALDSSDTFKDAWFWAVEDWWVDDVGGIVSSGPTQSISDSRRDTLTKAMLRRAPTALHTYFSFAHHNG